MDAAPGWYGKLPALGDFAQRRLPAAFVDVWDEWLAHGLAGWRAADPDWLDAYLAAPTWCFVLGPRALAPNTRPMAGSPAWAGVLMPSVDRVGRYFPLTVASALPAVRPADAPQLARWLAHQADCAVHALQDDWTAERLDQALLEDRAATSTPASAAALDEARASDGLPTLAQALAQGLARVAAHGEAALWWLPAGDRAPRLHLTRGLPSGAAFEHLVGGAAADPDAG